MIESEMTTDQRGWDGQNALMVALLKMENSLEIKLEGQDMLVWTVQKNDASIHRFRIRVEEL